MDNLTNFEYYLKIVRKNGRALRFIDNKTPELCLEAVKQNGLALEFVEHQTPEICLEAVKQDGYALKYVKHQTILMIAYAVINAPSSKQFVKIPWTDEIEREILFLNV